MVADGLFKSHKLLIMNLLLRCLMGPRGTVRQMRNLRIREFVMQNTPPQKGQFAGMVGKSSGEPFITG